jgi:hypothetical protein
MVVLKVKREKCGKFRNREKEQAITGQNQKQNEILPVSPRRR